MTDRVINILGTKSEIIRVEMIAQLTDEFRSGRNQMELLELLKSNDQSMLDIALYILGEINVSNDKILKLIVDRLFVLSNNEDPGIRYKTLINIASLTEDISHNKLTNIYEKMSRDPDDDIRETANRLLIFGNLKS